MPEEQDGITVIILSLSDPEPPSACGAACGGPACGAGGAPDSCAPEVTAAGRPRVPVLACRDALVAAGASVEMVTASSDQEIDAVIARLDGPARPDGLTWPAADAPALVVAAVSDGQLRAVIRRMVRRYAPPPSRRPADLPAARTVPDLPTVAILPLDGPRSGRPANDGRAGVAGGAAAPTADLRDHASHGVDLADRLGLPRDPAEVAKAVLGGSSRRLDLFRNDGGSVTVHGALLGGVDGSGSAVPWLGRVELDDHVLATGQEPVLAVAVANADGYAHLDELPLAPAADPGSGVITVSVAVPVEARSRWGRRSVRIEVRRASGRAVSVTPSGGVPFADDGVPGTLTRKRAWWVEPGAWSVATL